MARPTRSIDQRLLEAQVAIDNSVSSPVILARRHPLRLRPGPPKSGACPVRRDDAAGGGAKAGVRRAVRGHCRRRSRVGHRRPRLQKDPQNQPRHLQRQRQSAGGARPQRQPQDKSGRLDQTGHYLLHEPAHHARPDRRHDPIRYTQAKLEAEAALVEAVVAASAAQDKERGEAQEATQLRDAKLDELDRWVSDYKAIATVALDELPQRLEQLGWVVAS